MEHSSQILFVNEFTGQLYYFQWTVTPCELKYKISGPAGYAS